MLWLVVQGAVFILATLLVEAGSWRRLVCWWRRGQPEADTGDTEDKDLDEDVVKERLRVLSGKDADVLQVKNLGGFFLTGRYITAILSLVVNCKLTKT